MRELLLTKDKSALVDDADWYWLSQWNWFAVEIGGTWYARRSKKKGVLRNCKKFEIYLHRVVAHLSLPDLVVDHIDGNGLNNCRENLRICTANENKRNLRSHINSKSKYLGVTYNEDRNNWSAQLTSGGIQRLSMRFDTEELAAKAYDIAALEYHGEFANLNFKDIIYTDTLENFKLKYRVVRTISVEHKSKLELSRQGIDFTKLHREKRGRKVVNVNTGEIFGSVSEVAELINIPKSRLCKYLLGTRTNKTEFKYLS